MLRHLCTPPLLFKMKHESIRKCINVLNRQFQLFKIICINQWVFNMKLIGLLLFLAVMFTTSAEQEEEHYEPQNCNLLYKRLVCFRFEKSNLRHCMRRGLSFETKGRLLCLLNTPKCVTLFPSCLGKKILFQKAPNSEGP